MSGVLGTTAEASFHGAGGCLRGYLFDENVPRRLMFAPSLPVTNSSELGPHPTDAQLWAHAREHELVIVSKDSDFAARIMQSSPPPWIVHLRFGNLRRKDYHALLAKMWPKIEALFPEHKLVCVYSDRIQAFGE